MAEAQVASSFNPAELIKRVEDTEKRLQTKDAEIQVYKMLMAQMEEELAQAKKVKAIQEKQAQDVDSMKAESEKTLTKAKSLIFERTKIIKNQELQIEAFVQQIESLKEVVRITKDLLEIRNLEIKQLENKISAIEGKMKCEQERYDLMHQKLEQMIRHNGELKREYETQLCLFSALRERYDERELAKDVVEDLKENINEERKLIQDGGSNTSENKPADKKQDETEAETVTPLPDNSALIDAKNRLDNILIVLENTLESNSGENNKKEETTTSETLDTSTNVPADVNKPEVATVSNVENTDNTADSSSNVPADVNKPEVVTVSNNENTGDTASKTEVTENKTQAEANSTLDNIISALKNTIGLGSAVSEPAGKLAEESTSRPEAVEKNE